uniref:Uncharacterized protein n=1 Tax=Noctiluca scintillans TaxID=2966 RepID=A0A7S1ADI1_NOCSC
MGGSLTCSMHCTGMSKHVETEHAGFTERRTYPVADPIDAQLNWQTIAVRHAWQRANGGDIFGESEALRKQGKDLPAKLAAVACAPLEDSRSSGHGVDIVNI